MAEATGMRNNALPYPIYGQPFAITYPMLDADGDPVTGATTPDAEISKNGDTFADCSNESTEIATSSGIYYLLLTGTEMSTDIATIQAKSATAGMKTTVITLYPRKLVTLRSGTTQASTSTTVVLDSGASAIDDYYNGCPIACVLDGTTEVRMITDYVGSTKTCTVHVAWISGDPGPDVNDTFTIYLPEGRQITQADSVGIEGVAFATHASGLPPADLRQIAGSAVSTSTAQLGVNVVNFGGSAGTFASGRPEVNTSHIAGSAVSTSSAQIGVNVVNAGATAWNSGAIKTTTFTAGAIDAAAIAADAIGASELAADAATEIGTAVWATAARTLTAATNITSTGGTTVPQTGDAYARLGAPAGASVSADVAAVKSDTAAILTDTADMQPKLGTPDGASISADIAAVSGLITALPFDTITDALQGLALLSNQVVGGTGNDTTHVHLSGLTYGDDEINGMLLVLADASTSEYHSRWIEDWVSSTALATVATLPFTPTAGDFDSYWLLPVRRDAGLTAAETRAAIGLASANLDTQLTAIDDYLDTEVAAIKAKTDLIPAAPAAVGDIPTAVQNADALLGRNIAGGSSTGRTVKQALRALRNKVTRSGGTITVYQEDDTTSDWTASYTTDGAAEPITEVDPS